MRCALKALLMVVMLGGLLLCLIMVPFLRRPDRSNLHQTLYQGVSYTREARLDPRPLMIHILKIDTQTLGLRFLATPGVTPPASDPDHEFQARTTSAFLEEFGLQLAVNASFFSPFYARGLQDFYPQRGDPVGVEGMAVSDGVLYSPDDRRHAVLCISPQNLVFIQEEACPPDTAHAVAGDIIIAQQGAVTLPPQRRYFSDLHPRTAAAVDESGTTLWLIVVDGRQGGYSEGASVSELSEIALSLGATTAINLDGGGSSTMVVEGEWWPRLLNAPIHTGIPTRERPIANHLGIYAPPLQEQVRVEGALGVP